MQQQIKTCKIKDHDLKPIEFACIYPECNLSRFICSKCLKVGNHKHQQFDQDHIVDNREMLDYINKKIIEQGQDIKKEIIQFKQIIQEIQTQIKNMLNSVEQIEAETKQFFNIDELLEKLYKTGFNQLDDNQFSQLLKINYKQGDIYRQLSEQSYPIIQNLIRIQEWCHSQQIDDSGLLDKIKNAKCQLITQDQLEGDDKIYSSAISNDFKFIASGGTDKILKIWDYDNNTLIKSIQLDNYIHCIKFTDDSKLLYVANEQYLCQFDINNQFKETYKQAIPQTSILNMFCITNTIILTSSFDKTIIKTDVNLKQQLLFIKAHDDRINGLDFNFNLNMIVSASNDKFIKLWNGINGQLIIEKQNAVHDNHSKFINQVLFIHTNQLISLDSSGYMIIWNINFEKKLLEQMQQITDAGDPYNISFVLNQQYITLVCRDFIKIYSIKGNFIRSINHDVNELRNYQIYYILVMINTIQPQSMRAIIVQGMKTLQIIRIDLD